MKFTVSFKDPDALGGANAIRAAVNEELNVIDLDEDEREALREIREKKLHGILGKFFEYGEYVVIEVDTEAGTARVVPVNG